MTTCIRNADWVVAWEGRHVYQRSVDVAFDNGRITHVGHGYDGDVETEIDGRDRLVMPGMVNVHCHPAEEPLKKGFREEFGNPQLWWSPLFDRSFIYQTDVAGQHASAEYALCEMLRSGVTSIFDLSMPYEGWIDLLARSGLRAWAVPMYSSALWQTDNGHAVNYVWNEAGGRRDLDESVELAHEAPLKAERDAPQHHYAGRSAREVSPLSLPEPGD